MDVSPYDKESSIEKEQLKEKIWENEDLMANLESSLSNQDAERAAFKNLTDKNAKLQKDHDTMKQEYSVMEDKQMDMKLEIKTLQDKNKEQSEHIMQLELEIKFLKDNQGDDYVIKDMRDKLIRLSNEQEDKDKRLHLLQKELETTKQQLLVAKSMQNNTGAEYGQQSNTCAVM